MTTLKELGFEPDELDCARFSLGRVLSPMEVEESTRGRRTHEQDALAERWMVCGDLSADAFDRMTALDGIDLPRCLSGFRSSEGVHYGVITHQLGDYQHRFLLPGWSKPVCDFIRAVGSGQRYGFMFGRDGGNAAFVLLGHAPRETFGSVRRFFSPGDTQTVRRGFADLPSALGTLGRLDAIPSIVPGHTVRSVSMSVAAPPLSGSRTAEVH